jgi:hypothetical protein
LLVVVCTLVFTVNVPVKAPAGIVRVAGTVATAVLLLESATTAPPAGAAPLRVTVAVDVVPPWTVVGERVTDATVGEARTVRVPVTLVLAG